MTPNCCDVALFVISLSLAAFYASRSQLAAGVCALFQPGWRAS